MVFPDYYKVLPHYYGDTVRKLFLVAAVLMLLTLPVFSHLLPVSHFVPLFVVLAIGLAAGFTSPTQKVIGMLDVLVAGAGVIASGYYAIELYSIDHQDIHQKAAFVVSVAFALIFFFSFYYSVKTLRGFFLKK